MAAVYPTLKFYVDTNNDGDAGGDHSSAVVSNVEGQHGIFSYSDIERLAWVGSLRLSITNHDGFYNDRTYYVGRAIKVTLTLGIKEKQIWFGYITDFQYDPADWGTRRIHVTAVDWMQIAQNNRVEGLELELDKRMDEAVYTLLGTASVPPAYVRPEQGYETFPQVFDGLQSKSSLYSELDRIIKSEIGYGYLNFRDRSNGETFHAEDTFHRGSTHPLTQIPQDIITPSKIKWVNASASGNVKWVNADDEGYLTYPTFEDATFDRTMIDSEWEAGQYIVNQVSVSWIPRRNDTGVVVLYSLGAPIEIGANQQVILHFGYKDPSAASTTIQGFDVVTPVATTDYLFNELEDGSGTNYTSNLSLVSFEGNVNEGIGHFINKGPVGFLTFFRIRGKGIYKYNPVEDVLANAESQTEFMKLQHELTLVRDYSYRFNVGKLFARGLIGTYRIANKIMKTATFLANKSQQLMQAFMFLEVGDKVRITESQPSKTGDYYIQGIKFSITPGGLVYFTWFLKEGWETICEPISVEDATDTARQSALDFGILPYLANMNYYSYSLWVKISTASAIGVTIGRSVDTGSGRRGNYLFLNGQDMEFKSYKTPTDGIWATSGNVITVGQWDHVVVTYDNTTDTADPKIYINGVSQTLIESSAPSGTSDGDADCPLILFNIGPDPTADEEYHEVSQDIALKDVRVYNRILGQSDVDELFAGEDDYTTVQGGLQFQGIYVESSNITDYAGDAIFTDEDYVVEAVHGAGGRPYNETETSDSTMMVGSAL